MDLVRVPCSSSLFEFPVVISDWSNLKDDVFESGYPFAANEKLGGDKMGEPKLTLRFGSRYAIEESGKESDFDSGILGHRRPYFGWEYEEGELYSLLLFNETNKTLNMFLINAEDGILEHAQAIVPYTPLRESGRYRLIVYHQKGRVGPSSESIDLAAIQGFIKKEKMDVWTSGSFVVGARHSDLVVSKELEPKQRRYCSCLLKVAEKQTEECLNGIAEGRDVIGQSFDGQVCANPIEVCAKSVGTTSKVCAENYIVEEMTEQDLIGFAKSRRIAIPKKGSKVDLAELRKRIGDYKK